MGLCQAQSCGIAGPWLWHPIVDWRRIRVRALLPYRSALPSRPGSPQHPTMNWGCRDRSPLDADGIRRGLPEAVQVVERFQLWKTSAKRWKRACGTSGGPSKLPPRARPSAEALHSLSLRPGARVERIAPSSGVRCRPSGILTPPATSAAASRSCGGPRRWAGPRDTGLAVYSPQGPRRAPSRAPSSHSGISTSWPTSRRGRQRMAAVTAGAHPRGSPVHRRPESSLDAC